MSKKVNKKKEKILISFLIIIILSILVVAGIKQINKKDEEKEESNTIEYNQEDEIKEEYVEILQDGSKLNISDKLKENKKIDSLVLKDIGLSYKDGVTTLLANVKNTSKEISKQKEVEITLLNNKGEKLYILRGVIEEIGPGEIKQLNTSITADFANTYNFTIEEK